MLWKNAFYFDIDIVVKIKSKCGLAWSVLLSKTMRLNTVVKICSGLCAAPRESTRVHNILTTVMTCIVVNKSTDHAKPHSIC